MESSFRHSENERKPGVGRVLLDFANIFKAFIGTNYLSAAFNFSLSGLVLGVIGMLVIASVTVHCCHLIVICKQLATRKVLGYQDGPTVVEEMETESQRKLRKQVERQLSYGDIAWVAAGKWGLALVNFGLMVTQCGFCVGYFIFLGNTLHKLFPLVQGTVPTSPVTMIPNVDLNTALPANITNSSDLVPSSHHSGPASIYYILVASLIPIFVGFAFLRNIRHMGPASLVANISVLIGYIAVMGYILSDFEVSNTVELYQLATFPIFFGGMTGGYEGIGCIIPIESSMEENRGRFPLLLYSAVILFTFILASLGILGYLKYGDEIQQVIVWNLPSDSALPLLINSVICIGVLFTFPLQNFVAIEIFEELLFADGKLCGPPAVVVIDASSDEFEDSIVKVPNETSRLLPDQQQQQQQDDETVDLHLLPVATPISDLVPTWKRNILRTVIVLCEAAVAIIFKDDFAYVGSFIGAVGSTLLAFIIPCFIHIKLRGSEISSLVFIKDIAIILFGIIGGVASVYASVQAIINNF